VPSTIDRSDYVRFAGIQYQASSTSVGRPLTDDDLGPPYARVHCMLADLQFDPSYNELQDGNAAFLPAGTVVYRVKGYASFFRLAVRHKGATVAYEADVNAAARIGGDLLDLAGKVDAISIASGTGAGTTQLAAVTDPAKVKRLVDIVLASPVDQRVDSGHEGIRFFLVFRLLDGTAVMRAYWPGTGEVSRGIFTPPQFRTEIEQALSNTSLTSIRLAG
jgi:hypothetical protein